VMRTMLKPSSGCTANHERAVETVSDMTITAKGADTKGCVVDFTLSTYATKHGNPWPVRVGGRDEIGRARNAGHQSWRRRPWATRPSPGHSRSSLERRCFFSVQFSERRFSTASRAHGIGEAAPDAQTIASRMISPTGIRRSSSAHGDPFECWQATSFKATTLIARAGETPFARARARSTVASGTRGRGLLGGRGSPLRLRRQQVAREIRGSRLARTGVQAVAVRRIMFG
jgi:hypothetical protein